MKPIEQEDTATLRRTLNSLEIDSMGSEHAPTVRRLAVEIAKVKAELKRREGSGRQIGMAAHPLFNSF